MVMRGYSPSTGGGAQGMSGVFHGSRAAVSEFLMQINPRDNFVREVEKRIDQRLSQLGEDPISAHRNFKVVSANSAITKPRIQKRTMIFDSCHPSASKW